MEVFLKAATKHYSKNPTPETYETILLLSQEIQKILNPSEVSVVDAETQTIISSFQSKSQEKNYNEDNDTIDYIDLYHNDEYVLPKRFGKNKTHFYLSNIPKEYWVDNNKFDINNSMDVGIVYCLLTQRNEFYDNAPPNVYRCWRAATIIADVNGHVEIDELRSRGYTDEDINPLFDESFISDTIIRIALRSNNDEINMFKLNPYFW